MARPSKEELSTRPHVIRESRLQPDDSMNDLEKAMWIELLASLPAHYVKEKDRWALRSFVFNSVQAELVREQVKRIDIEFLVDEAVAEHYSRLQRIVDAHDKAAISAATKLRLTPQAMQEPKTVGRAIANHATGDKPWLLAQQEE